MTDWTAGYIADMGYTYGYYPELNPLRLQLAFLKAGLAPPTVGTACELGFGQGVSANLHAAGSTCRWYGTDFNPAQAAFAQELAAVSGANPVLLDEGFEQFCNRTDLPDFDFIGLHGIWSWISDTNQAVIVDFVRRKLKVGGVLYISYNTLPGWAQMVPMRHLLTEHADVMAAPGHGLVARIDAALAFADKLLATKPSYLQANPQVSARIDKMKEQSRNYVAHEYFNRDWQPMHFADMAKCLAPAKLSYACSAHHLDHVDGVNLSAEHQALLRDIADPMFRETVRDFVVNQQFRRDYWVRGARRLSSLEQAERLRSVRLMLVTPRSEVALKAQGARGEATLSEMIYAPILDALADHMPRSIGELEVALAKAGVGEAQLLQALMVLSAKGDLAAVQSELQVEAARTSSQRLNTHVLKRARLSSELNYMVSPLTGGGVVVGRFQQLFLHAREQGAKTPADWAKFAWDVIRGQGQRLLREGKPMESPEDNIAELTRQAQVFADARLPVLKALGIVSV
jgi:SAM-dependent methyltransferase